jgi:hypothetical protein
MSLSDEGRRIVDEARAAYGPSDDDRSRVGASLWLRVAAGAGAASAASAGSSSAAAPAGFLAGKGAVVGVAALVVIGGASVGYWWSRGDARPPAVAPASPVTAKADVTDQPGEPGLTPAAAAKAVEPPAHRSRSRSTGAPRVTGVKAAPLEPGPDVAGEVALLNEAQKALAGGHPDRALELLDRHARDFPRGSLTEERAAARIIALCALGRVTTARAEAAAFVRRAPASPLAERVQAACGTKLDPAAPAGAE